MSEEFGSEPHASTGWRLMTVTAIFISILGAVSIWIGARVFGLMCLVMAVTMSFLAGYLYRQRVLDSGRLARFKMFRLREDRDRA